MALRRPRRRDRGSADGECGLAARSDPRGSRSKAGTGGAAEAQRPARARRTPLRGSRLAKHRFLRAIVCFQGVARRKISASIFFCHVHPTPARPLGRPPSSGAKEMPRAGADFSFASSDFKTLGAFFCNFPKPGSRHSRGSAARAAHGHPPYQMLWVRGFRGHTISGRGFNLFKLLRRHFRQLRPPPLGWVPLAPSLSQGCRFFCSSNAMFFHRWFWLYCIQRLHRSQPNARVCKSLGSLRSSRSEPSATGWSGIVEATSRDASTNCVF